MVKEKKNIATKMEKKIDKQKLQKQKKTCLHDERINKNIVTTSI